MYYSKQKSYPGRRIVKIIEAGLIIAIIFFTIDAINDAFAPRHNADFVTVQRVVPEERVEPQQLRLSDVDYFYMGLEHQTRGDYYEAIADYNRSIEINPELAASWLNRGVAYEQLNNASARYDFHHWMSRDGVTTIMSGELAEGRVIEAEMAEGRVFSFTFDAHPGQILTVSAQAADGDRVDPLLLVLDDDGNPIFSDDDILRPDGSLISMNAQIANMGLRGGEYTLLVSHAGGGANGTVEVEFVLR